MQQYFAHCEGASRSEVEASYREYADAVTRTASRKDFDLATLRFIASLHNGHSQFSDSQMDGRPLKFRLLEVEGRYVVIGSQDRPDPPLRPSTVDGCGKDASPISTSRPLATPAMNGARSISFGNSRRLRA